MSLSAAARLKLGNLADFADRKVSEMIRQRGGTAANVRHTGHWAQRTLAEAAEAAAKGDVSAETAIKIVKRAKKYGQEH